MFRTLAHVSVGRPWVVIVAALILAGLGYRVFRTLPIEAFPDVTDPMVDVVGVYPGQSAEEVERRVTLELERVLAGTPHLIDIRSVSVFGLALVTLTFDDGVSDFEIRTVVGERLRDATLPDVASVSIGPQATPVGQIYRYTLRGNRTQKDLRSLQEFVVERRLRAVPGVADVVTFGGYQRQFHVRLDPARMAAADVSATDVYDALARSNANGGGGYVSAGDQELVVRSLGAVTDPRELRNILIRESASIPVRIADVAEISLGSTPRRGSVGRGNEDEVVEGIVLLRRGENPSVVLERLRQRVTELNQNGLPRGVTIDTFYDRTALVDATLETVGRNMLEGALFVTFLVYLFLRTARGALVVAVVIPLSLLTAFVGLRAMGLPANLISLGAIDFGILVDGAVIVLEATLHAMSPDARSLDHRSSIASAVTKVAEPVGYAMILIMVALLPIASLERTEGRIFAPMAFTYVFALIGALFSSMLVVPSLLAVGFRNLVPKPDFRIVARLRDGYVSLLRTMSFRRRYVMGLALLILGLNVAYSGRIGSEFLPELNEGGFYITATFPSTISADATKVHASDIRSKLMAFHETLDVLSHIGRPEAATQAEGSFNAEFFVKLRPAREWAGGKTKNDLEAEMRTTLRELPGVAFNFSQPITDRVYETISGIIGQVVIKVHGADLDASTLVAEEIQRRVHAIRGVEDLALYQAGSIPQLRLEVDVDAASRRGLSVQDIQRAIDISLGGRVATEIWQGERKTAVTLRLPDSTRAIPEELLALRVGPPEKRTTLGDVTRMSVGMGRTSIWRKDFQRFLALKFNVRGRDLGGTVEDTKRAIADVPLPEGMTVSLSGEFQNRERAFRRLGLSTPLALLAIGAILFAYFRRLRPVVCSMLMLPFGVIGAMTGLHAVGENFSVSSAVGCVALIGQLILASMVVCSRIDDGATEASPLVWGASEAFRPVLLTSTIALVGLIPAAISQGMGSETQRPFAISIIAGLLAGVPAVLFLLPLLYTTAGRDESKASNQGA